MPWKCLEVSAVRDWSIWLPSPFRRSGTNRIFSSAAVGRLNLSYPVEAKCAIYELSLRLGKRLNTQFSYVQCKYHRCAFHSSKMRLENRRPVL